LAVSRAFWGPFTLVAMWLLLAYESTKHGHAGGLLTVATISMLVAFYVGQRLKEVPVGT